MTRQQRATLIKAALKARETAYSPYSGFAVGAALLGESGKLYTGCNVENVSFGATNCAERTAVFQAVSMGEVKFAAIAIAGGKAGVTPANFCPPCGICRQVLAEFCSGDFPVLLVKNPKEIQETTLSALLPGAFTKEELL